MLHSGRGVAVSHIANRLDGVPTTESSSTGRRRFHARSCWFNKCRRRYGRIYELRVSLRGVHHRILYFFHGAVAAVVSHGLVKERVVHGEIERAVARRSGSRRSAEAHLREGLYGSE